MSSPYFQGQKVIHYYGPKKRHEMKVFLSKSSIKFNHPEVKPAKQIFYVNREVVQPFKPKTRRAKTKVAP